MTSEDFLYISLAAIIFTPIIISSFIYLYGIRYDKVVSLLNKHGFTDIVYKAKLEEASPTTGPRYLDGVKGINALTKALLERKQPFEQKELRNVVRLIKVANIFAIFGFTALFGFIIFMAYLNTR